MNSTVGVRNSPEWTTRSPFFPVPNFVLQPACTATLHIGPRGLLRQVELSRQTQGLVCFVEAGHYQSGRSLVGCLAQITLVQRQASGWNVHFRGLEWLSILVELETDREGSKPQGQWRCSELE